MLSNIKSERENMVLQKMIKKTIVLIITIIILILSAVIVAPNSVELKINYGSSEELVILDDFASIEINNPFTTDNDYYQQTTTTNVTIRSRRMSYDWI